MRKIYVEGSNIVGVSIQGSTHLSSFEKLPATKDCYKLIQEHSLNGTAS